jgi:hypothetical protein
LLVISSNHEGSDRNQPSFILEVRNFSIQWVFFSLG